VQDGGAHTPIALAAGAHTHTKVSIGLSYWMTSGYILANKHTENESAHIHTNPNTGYEGGHIHSVGSTGGPDDTAWALVPNIVYGSACGSGACIQDIPTGNFAEASHFHSNPNTGVNGGHGHSIGSTGSGSAHQHPIQVGDALSRDYVHDPITISTFEITTEPAHDTSINDVAAHPHTGVAEPAHSDHGITTESAHSDHTIVTQPAGDIDLTFGIHEEAAGTTLELLINSEVVASSYVGDQTDINVTGFCGSGNNTVEIRPIVGENGKKGSCTSVSSAIVFIEAKKF
jgi:hypothetical protein